MPQTLKLFKRQGVDFNHGYVTTPLCCPARATMYSGLYAHNHGILTNQPSRQFGRTYLPENTFPTQLQGAGYYTGQFGKYMNGWQQRDEGDAGFDVFRDDYNGYEHDRKRRGKADMLTARRGSRSPWSAAPGSTPMPVASSRYATSAPATATGRTSSSI